MIVVIPLYGISLHVSRLMEGKKYGGLNVSEDQTGQKDKSINSSISLLFILSLVKIILYVLLKYLFSNLNFLI